MLTRSRQPIESRCRVQCGASGIPKLLLTLLVSMVVQAEQLPVRPYTIADGLPSNVVNRIVRDSRGFLWFGTGEGLSRFDGYSFTTYGVGEGLPSPVVNDFLETSGGSLWVATERGLCRFHPIGAGPRFTVYYPGESRAARSITALYEDHSQRLWCGTRAGLYRLEETETSARQRSIL
jgi:ligand-binding sensor domain-containing protein